MPISERSRTDRHRWAQDRTAPPDLRLGGGPSPGLPGRPGPGLATTRADLVVARHTVRTSIAEYSLVVNGPAEWGRRGLGEAIRDAVAELRAIDLTYSPARPESLVSRLRRGEIAADAYPPLADLVQRCAAMRAATDGWFDAWAVPGGFDPGGLLKGWAVERAAARLRAAGSADYAVLSGGDLVVQGRAPHGGPWRIAVHQRAAVPRPNEGRYPINRTHPGGTPHAPLTLELTSGAIGSSGVAGRVDHVVDPHTGEPARQLAATTVLGPDLSVADAYATALYAAGPAGLDWFPTSNGYRALMALPRPARASV
ncbi:FAD:protein FMN transferase [Micromonospora sp. NPDC050417]|uniref:FAD:protein FMN transferase n=1 Tax=Micromonospora sp. NPDC050417 TaxID=3364280 RepID=UPI0037ABDD55